MSSRSKPQRSAQDQFGKVAASYSTSKTHARGNGLVSLDSMMTGRHYSIAVDIGAGPGFSAFAVAPWCDCVIATDVTPQMLEQVRSLRNERGAPETEMMLVAAEALPYTDGSLDLVVSRTAAHHFVDVESWLTEVKRVLAPKGELILIDTVSPGSAEARTWMHEIELWRDPSHVMNLSIDEWTSAIARAGLRVTSSDTSKVILEFPDWAERAGMEEPAMGTLGQAFAEAPNTAVEAFGIDAHADGTIDFYWPVAVVRAENY